MPAQKVTKPANQDRMVQRQTMDDPGRTCQVLGNAVDALESKLGKLQKLITNPPTITGSKGGNAALASLIAALAGLGIVKDGTT